MGEKEIRENTSQLIYEVLNGKIKDETIFNNRTRVSNIKTVIEDGLIAGIRYSGFENGMMLNPDNPRVTNKGKEYLNPLFLGNDLDKNIKIILQATQSHTIFKVDGLRFDPKWLNPAYEEVIKHKYVEGLKISTDSIPEIYVAENIHLTQEGLDYLEKDKQTISSQPTINFNGNTSNVQIGNRNVMTINSRIEVAKKQFDEEVTKLSDAKDKEVANQLKEAIDSGEIYPGKLKKFGTFLEQHPAFFGLVGNIITGIATVGAGIKP